MSFVTSAEGKPTKITDVYVQGPLGFEPNHIILDGVKIDSSGLMSDGTFKWKTTTTIDTYSKGDQTNKTLDEAWDLTMSPSDFGVTDDQYVTIISNLWVKFQQTLTQMGYSYSDNTGTVTYPDGTEDSEHSELVAYMRILNHFYYASDKATRETMVNIAGWTLSSTLHNPNENSKLALFLKSGDEYVGATAEIDLAGKNYSLTGEQFYESDTDDVIVDESTATPLSCKPGVYPLYAILTEKGDKTLISGPTKNS